MFSTCKQIQYIYIFLRNMQEDLSTRC